MLHACAKAIESKLRVKPPQKSKENLIKTH